MLTALRRPMTKNKLPEISSIERLTGHMPRDKRPMGERVHSIFLDQLGLSRDFSHARVARAMAALNAARAPLAPMVAEVIWLSPPTIERCRSDDPVAFALAHEIAHHDLGHLTRASRWVDSTFAYMPAALAVLGARKDDGVAIFARQ
jgi:hypothetical protein